MIGQAEFAEFAKAHGIGYETGLPKSQDRCGKDFATVIYPAELFEELLLKYLGSCKYVIVRMYPHYAGDNRKSLTRMRLQTYSKKPS